MANLTAAQIAAILDAVVYPAGEGVEVNAALMQNEERRKYPSIDVQNVTGDEKIKGVPTSTLGQTFLIHLFYRYRSFGQQEEPNIKVLEDLIFDAIDNNANFSTDLKVTVTQSWDRQSETFPVHRSHSTLTVSSEEISSTEGGGVPGDKIDITFPNPLGTLEVINLTADDRTLQKDIDKVIDGEEIFTKIHFTGLLTVEVELSVSQEGELDDLIEAGDDISVTLTKDGTGIPLIANLTTRISSATREVVQTTLITMDLKP